MRRVLNVTLLFTLSLLMAASVAAWSRQANFTTAELDELLAPIALYSDPLLAQILPAATYPDQLEAANSLMTYQGGYQMIDSQGWDVSVRSVAHYPSVLKMMVDSPDWTTAVAQAYVYQPQGTMASIQRLRHRARLNGYLGSNSYQNVAYTNGYTTIVPAQARYMYVPTYNPQVVYVTKRTNYTSNAIAFGLGLLIGAWLTNAIDWNHNRVYSHGWNGGGWIGRSRPYVQTNNSYSYYRGQPYTVNRNVQLHDISGYRQTLRSGAGTYVTPGLVRSTSFGRAITRPGGVSSGVGGFRTAPSAQPGVRAPRNSRPGVVMPRSIPRAGPRAQFNVPVARPKAGMTRQGRQASPKAPAVRSAPRANAGMMRTTPHASPKMPAVRSAPRANAGMIRTTPHASPKMPTVRSAPRANAGVTRQGRQASPKAAVVRSAPRASAGVTRQGRQASPKASAVRSAPRGNAGVTRQGRQASPKAAVVRSAPRANAGAVRQAPASGKGKAATRSSGKTGGGGGKQGKGQRK